MGGLNPETKAKIKETFQESYLGLLYEMLGTSLMTILVGNYYLIQNYNAHPGQIHNMSANAINQMSMNRDKNTTEAIDTSVDNEVMTAFRDMGQNYTAIFQPIDSDKAGLLLGMFVTVMFAARISGSHYNPCITLAYMMKDFRTINFKPLLCIFYIVAQFAGALLGGGLVWFYTSGFGKDINIELTIENNAWAQ